MTDFYGDMRDMTSELLEEFKRGVVQLKRTTTADPDPARLGSQVPRRRRSTASAPP